MDGAWVLGVVETMAILSFIVVITVVLLKVYYDVQRCAIIVAPNAKKKLTITILCKGGDTYCDDCYD